MPSRSARRGPRAQRTTARAALAAALAATLAAAAIWTTGGGPDMPSPAAEPAPDHVRDVQTPAAGRQPASAARPRSATPRTIRRSAARPMASRRPSPLPVLPAGADELRPEPRIRTVAVGPPDRDPGIVPDPQAIVPRHGLGSWNALYADCDRSTGYEVLDQFDIIQFITLYETGHPRADCDRSGEIDFLDVLCFMESFEAAAGRSEREAPGQTGRF